jgi:hypothetical protein
MRIATTAGITDDTGPVSLVDHHARLCLLQLELELGRDDTSAGLRQAWRGGGGRRRRQWRMRIATTAGMLLVVVVVVVVISSSRLRDARTDDTGPVSLVDHHARLCLLQLRCHRFWHP